MVATSPGVFDERYEIVGELGRGGMGRVLRARDLHASGMPRGAAAALGDEGAPGETREGAGDVAVKVLEEPALREPFVATFHLLRRLAHPAFAAAWDLGVERESGAIYAALELVEGAPLAPGDGGDEALVEVAATLLRAVDHLHRLGYVHGDLAPANLLATGDPDRPVRLLDLGAAGRAGDQAGGTSGVLTYAAPERLEGRPLSPASDLWSLGAVLFGLAHGRHPFPRYPREARLDGGPDRSGLEQHPLDGWLERMLAADPRARFPSAAAALQALEERVGRPLPLVTGAELARRLEHLPFVDVGGHLDFLDNRLRTAADAGRPQALDIGGPPGSGRTRLLTELAHRLVGHGLPVARAQVVPDELPGACLRRVVAAVGGARACPDRSEGPMAQARALLGLAREAARPLAVLIDDADLATPADRKALQLLVRTIERSPDRAGRLLLVVSGGSPDLTLDPWGGPEVAALLEALFPGRRVGARAAAALARRARGLPALVRQVLVALAARDGLEVTSTAVQLAGLEDLPDDVPGTVDEALLATLGGLGEAPREAAALLAHARAPVPAELAGPGAAGLLRAGLAVPLPDGEGARITLRSPALVAAARGLMGAREAARAWRARWQALAAGAEEDPAARAEAAWYGVAAGDEGAVAEARDALRTLPAPVAAPLAEVLVDEAWPEAAEDARAAAEALAGAGRLDRACEVLRRGARDEAAAPAVRAQVLARVGELEARQARHPRAVEAFAAALPLAGAEEEPALRANVLCGLARSAVLSGRVDEADAWGAEGLALVPDGPLSVRGSLRYTAGLVAWYRGDLDRAEALFREALEDVREAGDGVEEAAAVTGLGLVAHRRGDHDAAAARYREALALGEGCGDDARVLTSLQNLGVVLHERGQYTEALDSYAEALELAEALEQTGRVVQLAGNLGNLWLYLGELDRARGVLQRGLELARREGNRYMEGRILTLLGEAALADEAWPEARRLLEEAIAATVATRSATEEAEARLELTRLHLERQDYGEARDEAGRAREVAARAGAGGLEAEAMAMQAAALGRSVHGSAEEACALLGDALERLEAIPNRDQRWPVLLEAVHDARRREDPGAVVERAREVRRILRQLEDAVPARHRAAFRGLRERRRAWFETVVAEAAAEAPAPGRGGDERWSRLLEVNKRLSTEYNVQRLLEFIMDSAILLGGAERGFLLLADDAGAEGLDVRVARNLDQENIRNTRLKISHGIATRVLETGEPVLTVDAMEDERYRDQLSVHDLRLRSVLCLPMSIRGRVLGAIYLDNRFRASAFDAADVRLMEAFADQAGIALHNARLVEELERSRGDLERSREKVEELNEQLRAQLDQRTRELEDTHRVVVRQQRELTSKHRYDKLIGQSPAMAGVFRVMDRLLDNDIPVLIEGESGTGKELVARALHYNGSRQGKAFVAINCGAIPANLLESELFGHVRGSFTGASADKLGLFEAAHGGTLFLDEIGELPLEMQVKLLRVLQSGEIQKVGATKQTRVDARIVAATNRQLDKEVKGGRFREDLYYRLAVIPIRIPPLRERREDIPLLVQHFVEENRKAGLGEVTGVSKQALALLARYGWPGNVRQLEMVLKNASLFAEGQVLQPGDFEAFPEITGAAPDTLAGSHLSGRSLSDIERDAIIQALRDNRGNKKRTAEQLGIDRRTLYNKLAAYSITVEKELRVR